MLTVSNYHYIREDFKAPYPSIFGLTPKAFKKQLVHCRGFGEYIHPRDLVQNKEEIINSKKNYILISFDDGLKEQINFAKPILDSLKIPALFFVNTINFREEELSLVHKIHLLRSKISSSELIKKIYLSNSKVDIDLTASEKKKAILHYNYDDAESACLKYILNFKITIKEQAALIDAIFPDYLNEEEVIKDLYMTKNQLKDLAVEGMLGSHSHTHRPLGLLQPNEIEEDLKSSKQYLEELTQHQIDMVSYPYGSVEACSSPVTETALKLGFKIGFSMERGLNIGVEDYLLLKRFDCNDLPLGKNEKVFNDAHSFIYK